MIAIACLAAISRPAAFQQNPTNVRSSVSIFDIESKRTAVVYVAEKLWEAPNWSPDGKYLLANSDGKLYRFPLDNLARAQPQALALDPAYRCNNDHGMSPDGKRLAFSATRGDTEGSQVFVSDVAGSNPRRLTANAPSYFHSWSPDGNWLAFVGQRNGSFNLFRVSPAGGEEQRLTSNAPYDDGPDYSPDGRWIYFNSNRSGNWKIWRMPSDGAGPGDVKAQRVTSDSFEDWFPHPSPDGKWLVFLSFPKGTPGHDVKTGVKLRMIRLDSSAASGSGQVDDSAVQILTSFFGGQGTINVNSWSPDSKNFAFVSYELLR